LGAQILERFDAVRRGPDLVAVVLQQVANPFADGFVVVHHQYSVLLAR